MKNRIFIISDTHFFHSVMIEYCNRPKDFNEKLWKGLKQIKDNDTLIHLGDINIGRDKEVHKKLREYKFKKILVKGNHDHKTNNWYLENGWDFICYTFIDKYYGKKILFSHIPQEDNKNYDINIHGHCHNALRRKEYEPTIHNKQLLIAVENTNYQPVLLETIIKNFNK